MVATSASRGTSSSAYRSDGNDDEVDDDADDDMVTEGVTRVGLSVIIARAIDLAFLCTHGDLQTTERARFVETCNQPHSSVLLVSAQQFSPRI